MAQGLEGAVPMYGAASWSPPGEIYSFALLVHSQVMVHVWCECVSPHASKITCFCDKQNPLSQPLPLPAPSAPQGAPQELHVLSPGPEAFSTVLVSAALERLRESLTKVLSNRRALFSHRHGRHFPCFRPKPFSMHIDEWPVCNAAAVDR